MTEPEDPRRAEHEAMVAQAEAKGECWASGYPIRICKATICDCFDHEHVVEASYTEVQRYLHKPDGQ